MSEIQNIGSDSTAANNNVTSYSLQNLGKDDFLKLLITQLRMQDPLEPLEDKEFISQMAQFSALEQIQNLNESFDSFNKTFVAFNNSINNSLSKLQSLSFIGKKVEFKTGDGGTVKEGVVTGVKFDESNLILMVEDGEIQLADIVSVKKQEEVVETGQENPGQQAADK